MIKKQKKRNYKSSIIVLLAMILLFAFGCKKEQIDMATDNIVFLGDSITSSYDFQSYFPNKPIINSGVWGDRTDQAHARLESDVYSYKPKKVFILLGINDIGHKRTSEDITDRIETIISDIQKNCPYTEIFLISVYPINTSDFDIWYNPMAEGINDVVDDLNKNLVSLATKLDIHYLDIAQHLKNDNNEMKKEYTEEGIHLTDEAYSVISNILKDYIE